MRLWAVSTCMKWKWSERPSSPECLGFLFVFYSPPRPRALLHYMYSITVWSAAPQTTLWRGPGPRFNRPKLINRLPHLLECIVFLKVKCVEFTFFSIFSGPLRSEPAAELLGLGQVDVACSCCIISVWTTPVRTSSRAIGAGTGWCSM